MSVRCRHRRRVNGAGSSIPAAPKWWSRFGHSSNDQLVEANRIGYKQLTRATCSCWWSDAAVRCVLYDSRTKRHVPSGERADNATNAKRVLPTSKDAHRCYSRPRCCINHLTKHSICRSLSTQTWLPTSSGAGA